MKAKILCVFVFNLIFVNNKKITQVLGILKPYYSIQDPNALLVINSKTEPNVI